MEPILRQCECGICYQPMFGDRAPSFLDCGHLYCRLCIRRMRERVDDTHFRVECPECRTQHTFTGDLPVIYQMNVLAEMLQNYLRAPKVCEKCSAEIIGGPHYCQVCYETEETALKHSKRRYVFKSMTPYQRYQWDQQIGQQGLAEIVPKDTLLGPGQQIPSNAVILTGTALIEAQYNFATNHLDNDPPVAVDSRPASRVSTTVSYVHSDGANSDVVNNSFEDEMLVAGDVDMFEPSPSPVRMQTAPEVHTAARLFFDDLEEAPAPAADTAFLGDGGEVGGQGESVFVRVTGSSLGQMGTTVDLVTLE